MTVGKRPKRGDWVDYHRRADGLVEAVICSALVTGDVDAVHGKVDLTVFPPALAPEAKVEVPFDPEQRAGTWRWGS